jgi:hypothetical protein
LAGASSFRPPPSRRRSRRRRRAHIDERGAFRAIGVQESSRGIDVGTPVGRLVAAAGGNGRHDAVEVLPSAVPRALIGEIDCFRVDPLFAQSGGGGLGSRQRHDRSPRAIRRSATSCPSQPQPATRTSQSDVITRDLCYRAFSPASVGYNAPAMEYSIEGFQLEKSFTKKRTLRELFTKPFAEPGQVRALRVVSTCTSRRARSSACSDRTARKDDAREDLLVPGPPDRGRAVIGGFDVATRTGQVAARAGALRRALVLLASVGGET